VLTPTTSSESPRPRVEKISAPSEISVKKTDASRAFESAEDYPGTTESVVFEADMSLGIEDVSYTAAPESVDFASMGTLTASAMGVSRDLSDSQRVAELMKLQNVNGSWTRTAEVAALLPPNISTHALSPRLNLTSELWVTILLICFLRSQVNALAWMFSMGLTRATRFVARQTGWPLVGGADDVDVPAQIRDVCDNLVVD